MNYGKLQSFKRKIKPLHTRIVNNSVLRVFFYHVQNLYFILRYLTLGRPRISEADRQNVERNITFIYKSFNRQKQAKKLYRCIKRYYPGARVIIADDSHVPLDIREKAEGDTVINLPFNVGLSKGLIAALELVDTPFVQRMDDDMLLTPSSRVHDQLSFLQAHEEVDLVGIQADCNFPEQSSVVYTRIRMNRPLIIPAGTQIDGRTVVYKAPNVFLCRTESLRRIGYDPNIRMIDHHEFFFRAAGNIVCVQDPHSYVMHCHNKFENKAYTAYRGDYQRDLMYIYMKHGSAYR